MLKIFLFFIYFFFLSIANAAQICNVVGKYKVVCKESDFGLTLISIFFKTKDDEWIEKKYFSGNKYSTSVFVNGYKQFNYAQHCPKPGESSENSDLCKEMYDAEKRGFISLLSKGKSNLPLEDFSRHLSNKYEISSMYCRPPDSQDSVITFKHNKITGLMTDRKDYHGLKPGTYCEDFLANDDLFWEQPK